jgi:hypothetical protein
MTTDSARPLATTVAEQHARIRAMLAEVSDLDGPRRGERFADLARYLAIQQAAKQEFLQRTDTEQAAMVARLEHLGPDDPSFFLQLSLLEEALEEHADHTEKTALPAIEGALDAGGLRRAQDGMALVEVLYEERGAGAAVPVDGGFQAQQEAARNALRSRIATTRADGRSDT